MLSLLEDPKRDTHLNQEHNQGDIKTNSDESTRVIRAD